MRSIIVHDRYAKTMGRERERELDIDSITDAFEDTISSGTFIWYNNGNRLVYIITEETPEEIKNMIEEKN